MRQSDLGEFEELVLLAIGVLHPDAYSVVIAEQLELETGKKITTGAVHASLQRLEKKGYVTSEMGEASAKRGGRRKRLYTITIAGSKILHDVHEVRANLWSKLSPESLPNFNFQQL